MIESPLIPKEVQEVAASIGQFFLDKNNFDYNATAVEIEKLGIHRIEFDGPKLAIELSRPGLLIGLRGKQICDLEAYLNLEIHIVETRQHIVDFLIPIDYSKWEDEHDE